MNRRRFTVKISYLTSDNSPVAESMMKPRTVTSEGINGWFTIVATVLRTDVASVCFYKDIRFGEELYERTFHNHREAILDTFGIEIKCDRSLGYYIANSEDLEGDGYDSLWIYALDERMQNVTPNKKALKMPARFNAQEFFGKYYGIIAEGDEKPWTVELKVAASQVKYIESLPLHKSQIRIQETPEYNIYQYHLVPKFDFRQEILRWGPDVEVLGPEWFRDEVKADIAKMYKNYGL